MIFLALALPVALAQQAEPGSDPRFETASIRPVKLTPGCFSMFPPGGMHYSITCVRLRDMIAMAWKVHPDNIQGGDTASLDAFYDLNATTPGDKPWTSDSIPPMLRNLLIERFHVSVHPGTKQVSGYSLVVAKGGAKLKPAESPLQDQGVKAGEPARNFIVPGYVCGRGVSLITIAALLSLPAHETVIDETGLSGVYDVDVHYAPEDSTDSALPSFFTAVEEQLGLKLKRGKVTVNTVVIEHVDTAPTPN